MNPQTQLLSHSVFVGSLQAGTSAVPSAWQVLIYTNGCFQHPLTAEKVALGRTGKHELEKIYLQRESGSWAAPPFQPLGGCG